ncbi:hypothetical protein C8F04DRAFT_1300985 [Mycena alexandri]|uniref:Uncharacterized protein n=1 Tax=Mycena alexandri TaxID=1745969 RepID=A0AAD6XB49_9AGAR|nr:hypothetical protein C8F04DRAFT_1300985 [Mycena alexandri]
MPGYTSLTLNPLLPPSPNCPKRDPRYPHSTLRRTHPRTGYFELVPFRVETRLYNAQVDLEFRTQCNPTAFDETRGQVHWIQTQSNTIQINLACSGFKITLHLPSFNSVPLNSNSAHRIHSILPSQTHKIITRTSLRGTNASLAPDSLDETKIESSLITLPRILAKSSSPSFLEPANSFKTTYGHGVYGLGSRSRLDESVQNPARAPVHARGLDADAHGVHPAPQPNAQDTHMRAESVAAHTAPTWHLVPGLLASTRGCAARAGNDERMEGRETGTARAWAQQAAPRYG